MWTDWGREIKDAGKGAGWCRAVAETNPQVYNFHNSLLISCIRRRLENR